MKIKNQKYKVVCGNEVYDFVVTTIKAKTREKVLVKRNPSNPTSNKLTANS